MDIPTSAFKNLCLPAKFYFLVQTSYVAIYSLIFAALALFFVYHGLSSVLPVLFGKLALFFLISMGVIVGMTWLYNFICHRESVHIAWLILIGLYGLGLLLNLVMLFISKSGRDVYLITSVVLLMIMTAAIVTMEESEKKDKK